MPSSPEGGDLQRQQNMAATDPREGGIKALWIKEGMSLKAAHLTLSLSLTAKWNLFRILTRLVSLCTASHDHPALLTSKRSFRIFQPVGEKC
jgi:hypothetical protein